MGRLIGRLLATFIFGWLLNVCLVLFRRLLEWLELDAGPSAWPWQWVLPKLALLGAVVGLLAAGLVLLARLLTGGAG